LPVVILRVVKKPLDLHANIIQPENYQKGSFDYIFVILKLDVSLASFAIEAIV
jgi:hypothetical protein